MQKFYSNEYGRIPPGTKMWRVVVMCLLPFVIPYLGSYTPDVEDESDAKNKFYYYYTLPVVKFISSTISCIHYHIINSLTIIII